MLSLSIINCKLLTLLLISKFVSVVILFCIIHWMLAIHQNNNSIPLFWSDPGVSTVSLSTHINGWILTFENNVFITNGMSRTAVCNEWIATAMYTYASFSFFVRIFSFFSGTNDKSVWITYVVSFYWTKRLLLPSQVQCKHFCLFNIIGKHFYSILWKL